MGLRKMYDFHKVNNYFVSVLTSVEILLNIAMMSQSIVPTRMRDLPLAWMLHVIRHVSLVYILYNPQLGS
jgi:archaellum biogenesis protein FlaJ (TadC family)